MRAWILNSEENPDSGCSLVWAESRGKAKQQANYDSPEPYQSSLEEYDFTKIRAVRAQEFDDCEDLSEKEICLRLMKLYNWWFYVDGKYYNEDNIEEFKKLFER